MSLRGFHIAFIFLSSLLAFGCAAGVFVTYRHMPVGIHLVIATISALVGVALIAYGVWFIKKSRSLIL